VGGIVLRGLVTFLLPAALLLAGCGGGGGGGEDASSNPAPASTPVSASFPAASAYRAYAASARQQSFSLSPFGFCFGDATLTETAPAAATFEGRAAVRKTSTWVLRFNNCVPNSDTDVIEVFLDANNAEIGEFRAGVGYVVFDRPLALPTSVKVGDAGSLTTASIFTDSTKKTLTGKIDYSFVAEEDSRADSILVRVTARTTHSLGQQVFSEAKTYRITAGGAMELRLGTLVENGRTLVFAAD
jgi:hypothetical protein